MQKITMETLAEMVQRGFLEQEEKFNKRFDAIEARIGQLERRVNAIEMAIDAIKGELCEIRAQLVAIDCRAEIGTLKIRVDRIEQRFKET
jgi:chromosome segregation ATPase